MRGTSKRQLHRSRNWDSTPAGWGRKCAVHSRVPRADGTWCSTGPQSQSHSDRVRRSQNLGVGLLLTKASPNNTPNGISDHGLLWEHWDPYNESPKIKWTQQNRIYISYSEILEILIICLEPGIVFIYCSSQIYFSVFHLIFWNWLLILSFKVLGIFSVGFLSRQDPIKKNVTPVSEVSVS